MNKKAALAAVVTFAALIATGCTVQTVETAEPSQTVRGVDIVIPYATSTICPDATIPPDALYITSDGSVVLNDDSLLGNNSGNVVRGDRVSAVYNQLRRGDTSPAVSAMQERLAELNYYEGGISGIFDEATEKAVKLFERAYGIMQTGIATSALQEKVFSEDALVYNSKKYQEAVESFYVKLDEDSSGSNVIALQMRLQELGYPVSDVTGKYDDSTRKAMRKFYRAHGLDPNNYATVGIQKLLYSDEALTFEAARTVAAPQTTRKPNDFTLMYGDTDTRVMKLQMRLVELGYLQSATGTYDDETFDAVSNFQSACYLESDGIASEDLQQQLFAHDAPAYGTMKQLYAQLKWGDSGKAVENLQRRLAELGFYTGDETGVFSDDTAAAVKRFQTAAGMSDTGVVTIEMQELAFSENAPLSQARAAAIQDDAAAAMLVITSLADGDEGEDVTALQNRLKELGYYTGTVDGQYGAGTTAAVKEIQKAMGVLITGNASGDLINIILSDAAPNKGEKYTDITGSYQPLKKDDQGNQVIELQRALWELGLLDKTDVEGAVGIYNTATADSVNALYKAMGCKLRDGRASAELQSFLFSGAAKEYLKPKSE